MQGLSSRFNDFIVFFHRIYVVLGFKRTLLLQYGTAMYINLGTDLSQQVPSMGERNGNQGNERTSEGTCWSTETE